MWFWGGTSSASLQKEATDVSKQDFYSADHLLALFDSLPPFEAIDERNREFTIEALRQIAEVLVWGEQHNRGYFDVFCEQNVLSYFVRLAEQPGVPNAVKVQLLQTLSIIVQSINKDTAVYYMFSNNYINALLSTKFDFEDEEVASWYVSFIKSLSLLVNRDTIKLFLNERAKHFPIYSEAVKFFIAKDSMVRTHCRNVTLCIFKVQDTALRTFLLERPIFFSHVACYLQELLNEQLSRLAASDETVPDRVVRDKIMEVEEMLLYIQDIFSLNVDAFSHILAERLLVYCYFPVIGLLGMADDCKAKRGQTVSDEGERADKASAAGDERAGFSHEDSNFQSPSGSMEADVSPAGGKKPELGWMWGWGSLHDPQGAAIAGEVPDLAKEEHLLSSFATGQAADRIRSWGARAAQAMSMKIYDTERQSEQADESPAASVPVANTQKKTQTERSTILCETARRVVLLFLIQTFNCIQNEMLLRPIVAALLYRQLPRPMHDLLLAKAPAVPAAYKRLRNPTECSGHIELFLPTEDSPTPDTSDEDLRGNAEGTPHPASISFEERAQMLRRSLQAFHDLDCFEGQGRAAETHGAGPARRSEEPAPTKELPDSSPGTEYRGEWCYNPFRRHLLSLVEPCVLEESQSDACFLLLGLLLLSVLRHASTTQDVLMHASMIPRCGARALSAAERTQCQMPASPAPSTRGGVASTQEKFSGKADNFWGASASQECSDKSALPPTSAEPSSASHDLDSAAGPLANASVDYGRGSWSFTAHMLDSIQAHLCSPFLRPITVRVALSAFATLIVDYVLKVQSFEYRLQCMKVLAGRVAKLRRAAAIATKLCLSALSDGHAIDIFWDEWEVHRAGHVNPSALYKDFHILMSPQESPAGGRSTTLPPYLLVASADQELERRAIQIFLLFRRLHRNLCTILHTIIAAPKDVLGVAEKAFSFLCGVSSESNPFESEDGAAQSSHSGSKVSETVPETSLSLEGRNLIRCTVETSSGPATRYCVQDDKRFLLVSPSSTRPGVADIRTSHPLRNVECRLRKNSSRCIQLLVLDVTPPADGPSRLLHSASAQNPPTMQISLTAPPVNGDVKTERPALWEIRLQFADAVRCNTVFVSSTYT